MRSPSHVFWFQNDKISKDFCHFVVFGVRPRILLGLLTCIFLRSLVKVFWRKLTWGELFYCKPSFLKYLRGLRRESWALQTAIQPMIAVWSEEWVSNPQENSAWYRGDSFSRQSSQLPRRSKTEGAAGVLEAWSDCHLEVIIFFFLTIFLFLE